jgi:type II secretory pathway pseudopilin PulG
MAMWWFQSRKNKRGYTLVELAITGGIVSLIAAAAVFGIARYRNNAEDARMEKEMGSIYQAVQAYRLVYGRYPASYAQLSEFITIPNFDQRYELNPNP